MQNKLCLGTVQVGMKYGIKNENGDLLLNKEKVFSIFETAIENGIRYFDTASVYGNAEKLIGDFLKKHPSDIKVISKLKPILLNEGSFSPDEIKAEIKKTLENLQVAALDGYILHEAKNMYKNVVLNTLQDYKEKGLVKNVGVSIYEPEDALYAVKDSRINYIQIPYNVFDQRLDYTDFFELAKKNKVEIFARSSFLQGLLTMDVDEIPIQLSIAKPYMKRFQNIISEFGYSKIEAAFLFSHYHSGIDKVVFGVDSKEELVQNIQVINRDRSFKDCYYALKNQFIDIDKKIIMPNLWGEKNGSR